MGIVKILVSDRDCNDLIVTIPRDEAIIILNDVAKLASERMNLLCENGILNLNPNASEMNEAMIFLSWPDAVIGSIKNENWDKEFAEDLYYLAHGEYNND